MYAHIIKILLVLQNLRYVWFLSQKFSQQQIVMHSIRQSQRSKTRVCGGCLARICVFESDQGLFLLSVLCYQVEISATGRSPVQRSPSDSCVSLLVIYEPQEWGGPDPRWAFAPEEKYFLCTNIRK